jgi:hypothetical protein
MVKETIYSDTLIPILKYAIPKNIERIIMAVIPN